MADQHLLCAYNCTYLDKSASFTAVEKRSLVSREMFLLQILLRAMHSVKCLYSLNSMHYVKHVFFNTEIIISVSKM